MKRHISWLGCSVLIVLCCSALYAQDGGQPGERSSLPARQVRGGIVNLYALDPLARSLCFRDGREGLAFQKNRWANRCSDLNFSLAGNGSFVTGIEANRVAAIVDLGTANDLRERYGYEDADSGGEGFASLRLQGDRILILKEDNPNESLQPLKEGLTLFTELGPSANAPVRLGHIYLLRIADRKDKSYQQIVKLIVIAYAPNESVTLRWEPL
ncbi:MAG: hypothetical protein ND895_23890 [Pyrinomonadaceae bacterium]|nr:hypothetical protein [Pyrinomonadaceae bacterium]